MRTWRRWWRPTLARQFLLLQVGVLALVLLAVFAYSIRTAQVDFREVRGQAMRASAERLATSAVVRDRVGASDAALTLAPSLVNAVDLSTATVSYVTDPRGRVVASSDPTLVGTTPDRGESDALEGRGWSGDLQYAGERAVAAHAPVLSVSDGTLLGVAVVAEDYPSLNQQVRASAGDLLVFLGLGALLGLAGSIALSALIRRRTRGLEPSEIATLAEHREALLHSIREGVVAVNPEGVVSVLNDSARDLLDLPADAVGRPLVDLDLPVAVRDALTDDSSSPDRVVVVGGRAVVLNRQRASSATGDEVGTVTTLRDRTELLALQSQLDATRSVTDALRSQTHEFANRLHTIHGLVQLEEYDEVGRFIGTLSRQRAEINDAVTQMIADPTVAALIVAKTSAVLEAGLELAVAPGSRLGRLDSGLASDVTTVVGNLVDNAVDATRAAGGSRVEVRLDDDGAVVRVVVRDEGAGLPDDPSALFERGYSTKEAVDAGRGIGLTLVQMVCERRGGSVVAENDHGAVFTALVPYREVARG
ncbi:ATP-binding protein [Solicola sp. PLA-1-18]|uniref:sensor histidine kinase n=1 Tax=Solicola sp. PLA-1-18 TaxID=3380532 RepID=UPI003B7A1E26